MVSTIAVDKIETVNETHVDMSAGISGSINLNGSISGATTASIKAPGMIIQTQGTSFSNRFTFDPDGTWTECGSGALYPWRVTITPTSLTNKLFMQLHLFANETGTNDIWNWKLVDMTEDNTGNTLVTPKGDGAGSRFEGHFAHRGKYDSNDPIMQNYILYADITRTTATTYTLWGRNGDGGAPIYVNYSSSDNGSWGFTGVCSFIIQEIQI